MVCGTQKLEGREASLALLRAARNAFERVIVDRSSDLCLADLTHEIENLRLVGGFWLSRRDGMTAAERVMASGEVGDEG